MARRPLPPIGFWSYARPDDELSGGQLSRLRALIRSELQQQYGREPIQLFQDISAISHGSRWEGEIRRALENSTFFIPILSPNFLQSEWCVQEVEIFRERQERLFDEYRDLPRTSRIFPIHYIDITGIEALNPDVDQSLRELQWFDFREHRHSDFAAAEVRRTVSSFATSVRDLLRIGVEQPDAPEASEALAPRPAAPPRAVADISRVEGAEPGGGNRLVWIAASVAALLAAAAIIYFLVLRRPTDSTPVAPVDNSAAPASDAAEETNTAAEEGGPGAQDMEESFRRELVGRWGDNAQCSGETWEFRADMSYQTEESGRWSVDGSILTMASPASTWRAPLEWMDDGVLRVSPPGAASEVWHRCPT